MKDESRNVIVGITAMAGLVGLAAMLVMFGYVPGMLEKGYTVRVELEKASGLSKGSLARLSGIPIGRITSIELTAAPKVGVVAVLLIDEGIRIPHDVQVEVEAPILTGSSWLAFSVPSEREPSVKMLPTDGSAVLQGTVPELVNEFARAVRRIEKNFNELSEQWTKVGDKVIGLLEDRPPEPDDADQTKVNLMTVLNGMDQRLTHVGKTLDKAHLWLDQVIETTDKFGATVDDIRTTANKATENMEQLKHRYVALADDLSKTIVDIQKLATQASEGKGAVGKLLNDPALYDNLDDTAKRIGLVADELKLLLEKWKAEGVPVQF